MHLVCWALALPPCSRLPLQLTSRGVCQQHQASCQALQRLGSCSPQHQGVSPCRRRTAAFLQQRQAHCWPVHRTWGRHWAKWAKRQQAQPWGQRQQWAGPHSSSSQPSSQQQVVDAASCYVAVQRALIPQTLLKAVVSEMILFKTDQKLEQHVVTLMKLPKGKAVVILPCARPGAPYFNSQQVTAELCGKAAPVDVGLLLEAEGMWADELPTHPDLVVKYVQQQQQQLGQLSPGHRVAWCVLGVNSANHAELQPTAAQLAPRRGAEVLKVRLEWTGNAAADELRLMELEAAAYLYQQQFEEPGWAPASDKWAQLVQQVKLAAQPQRSVVSEMGSDLRRAGQQQEQRRGS